MTEKEDIKVLENHKLFPCPFCMGKATMFRPDCFIDDRIKMEKRSYVAYMIECKLCGCKTKCYESEEEAIKVWNTRKPTQEIIELVEMLKIKERNIAKLIKSIEFREYDEDMLKIIRNGGEE